MGFRPAGHELETVKYKDKTLEKQNKMNSQWYMPSVSRAGHHLLYSGTVQAHNTVAITVPAQ